jgi:hypothetical protein
VKGGRKGGQQDRHRAGAQIIVVRSAPHTHDGNTRDGKAGVKVEGEDRERQGVCTPELANARACVRQHMQCSPAQAGRQSSTGRGRGCRVRGRGR